jgi:hypothetical protein
MRTQHFLQSGQVIKKSKLEKLENLFHLERWLKKTLTSYGVGFKDPCCAADTTKMPVVYNEVTARLERFDSVTGTWVAA